MEGMVRERRTGFVAPIPFQRTGRRRVGTTCERRRVRALADGSSGSTSGGKEPASRDESDTAASDLVLPDLRNLFAGSGAEGCEQCAGKGTVECPVCGGKGFVTLTMMDVVSSSQCRLCKGKRNIPCPTCREEVYKSVIWWDLIPSDEDDPNEEWREGPEGEPRVRWTDNPAGPDPH